MPRRLRTFLAGLTVLAAPLAACSSGDGDSSDTTVAGDTTAAGEATAEPLQILVSNDDGVDAEGIDALVEGLLTLDDVEVTVVAPLEQQSGTGGSETEGELEVTEATLASGYEATAVDGFPADSVRVALDEQGLEPDLVISGINEGQNLGPLTELSGTVGAARAAASRGLPALATSQGFGEPFDYEVAVPLILAWVSEHRADLAAGDEPAGVTSLNVPSCTVGEVRGLVEVTVGTDQDGNPAEQEVDCSDETQAMGDGAADISAFNAGYATIGPVSTQPAGE